MQPFEFNPSTKDGVEKAYYVDGYMKMMQQILVYIEKETECKPEKRYIDSLKLLEKIMLTNKEVGKSIQLEILIGEINNVRGEINNGQ